MVMYKATSDGDVLLTAEEEALIINEQNSWNSIENQRKLLKLRVTKKRQEVEKRFLIVDGIPVATDDYSHSRVSRALEFINQSGKLSIDFKGADGNFYNVSDVQLANILLAISTFINSCYEVEAQHCAAINAANDLTDYDISIGWPS